MPAVTHRACALALLAAFAVGLPIPRAVQADQPAPVVKRLPDGMPNRVLKFEFCRTGTCDRAERGRWSTHYLVPPPGEVCRLSDVAEALRWIEENRPGWRLAGWGCVSTRKEAA